MGILQMKWDKQNKNDEKIKELENIILEDKNITNARRNEIKEQIKKLVNSNDKIDESIFNMSVKLNKVGR